MRTKTGTSAMTTKLALQGSILLNVMLLGFVSFKSSIKESLATTRALGSVSTRSDQVAQPIECKTRHQKHMDAVLEGCGDICRIDMKGVPSLFHNYMEKLFDCKALLMNEAIDAAMTDPEPPNTIPEEMMDAFTYGGQVQLGRYFADKVFNDRYLGKQVRTK